MLKRLLYFLLIFMAFDARAQLFPTFGNSRTGASGMQFLKIAQDARSISMAGAVVGVSSDPSALFWNPAGITRQDESKVNFLVSGNNYFAGSQSGMFGLTAKAGKLSHVGLSVISMNYGSIDETTEFQPGGTGRQVLLSNTLIGLTYAKVLTESFSFGLNAKWAHEGIADVTTNNVLFDLGLHYNIGIKHSRFGVSFSNFGLNVSPSGEVTVLKFSGDQKVSNFSSISTPGLFRIGAAFDPIHNKEHILTAAAQLTHPTDNNEILALGAEYSFKKLLYGRTGWEFGSDERIILPTLGFGIKLPRRFGSFGFDYSFVVKEKLGNMHCLTLQASIF